MPIVSGNDYEQDPVAWASAAQRDIERLFQLIQAGTNDGNTRAYSGQENATELRPQPFYPKNVNITGGTIGGVPVSSGAQSAGQGALVYTTQNCIFPSSAVFSYYDSVGFDPNGIWDNGTQAFIAPMSGVYYACASIMATTALLDVVTYGLRKNGVAVAGGTFTPEVDGATTQGSTAVLVQLAGGDSVDLYVTVTSGTGVTRPGGYFTLFRLGQ